MSNIAPLIDHYLAEYARLERDLPGSDANQRARKDALKAFAEAGFPDTRQEEWKYTSLRPVEKRRFEASSEAGDVSQDALAAFLPADLDAYRIVIVDGHFDPRLSSLDGLPQGVQVQSFAPATRFQFRGGVEFLHMAEAQIGDGDDCLRQAQ